jgi:hypothetical protein
MMLDRIDGKIIISLDESEDSVLDDHGVIAIRDTLLGFFEGRKRVAQQAEMRKLYEGFGKLNTRDQHSVRTIIASATPGEPGRLPIDDRAKGNNNLQVESVIKR